MQEKHFFSPRLLFAQSAGQLDAAEHTALETSAGGLGSPEPTKNYCVAGSLYTQVSVHNNNLQTR